MRIISGDEVESALDFPVLIDRIRAAFRNPPDFPPRHHHDIACGIDRAEATLLIMPAWRERGLIGVKTVTIFPDNAATGLPAVQASYQIFSGQDGVLLGLIDGKALTNWRTAAVSALAASVLVRKDAATLLIVGTGALAPYLARAHMTVHDYERVLIWGRDTEKARTLASTLANTGVSAEAVGALDTAVGRADTISAATLAVEPLIRGASVKPGAHVDLVGAFRAHMRESDDTLMARGRLFVDNRPGIMTDGGDILQSIESGAIAETAILGDLFSFHRDSNWQRLSAEEVTVFKSVGCAPADYAAAELIWERTA